MVALNVKTADDARELIEQRNLSHVKLGIFDADGVLRGKYVSRDKFLSALDNGFGFCDVVLAWDSNDQLYDNVKYTGWHTGYPDAEVRVLPETCRELYFEEGGLFFLCEFKGEAEQLCPRGVLRRVLAKAESMGVRPFSALEYEFFVFDETPHSVQEKDFRNLRPITPGNFGYSVLRASVWSDLYGQILEMCDDMNFGLEGLHTETGPGVLEAAIQVDEALNSADKAALFKTFMKVLAERHELMATFMAKWSMDYPGQSGHIHLSLKDMDGKSLFYEEGADHTMSTTMRHFVGGCQQLMPETLAMIASTVNSYTRLIPGYWAPTTATWGVENRTCALRVIPGSAKSQRVEYRVAAADANPYLALAAALASGLYGIENEIEPDAPIVGNAYEAPVPDALKLPSTLWEAAQRLKGSDAARSLFGDLFVDHFASSREWEEREFRRHVTDWELRRYFEII
ncbi:MAG: glutamine synthetase [Myxococcales bacterium]|nr:glutamine synthetase [Myxococcales bacterium]|tara:strand:+ start:415 stop:1782 length:1368 start_codon:yes stop_codon:yes gene_type:complete